MTGQFLATSFIVLLFTVLLFADPVIILFGTALFLIFSLAAIPFVTDSIGIVLFAVVMAHGGPIFSHYVCRGFIYLSFVRGRFLRNYTTSGRFIRDSSTSSSSLCNRSICECSTYTASIFSYTTRSGFISFSMLLLNFHNFFFSCFNHLLANIVLAALVSRN